VEADRTATPQALAVVVGSSIAASIGARGLPAPNTRTDVGQLLRTLGFAATPGLIQALGIFPGMKMPIFALASGWAFVAIVIALRQALDYTTTRRALAVCALAVLLSLTITAAFGLVFGPTLSGWKNPANA